jgi:hypothetical protein
MVAEQHSTVSRSRIDWAIAQSIVFGAYLPIVPQRAPAGAAPASSHRWQEYLGDMKEAGAAKGSGNGCISYALWAL